MLNNKGFSLIEMYMTIVILALVMGVLVYGYLAGQTVFNGEKNISDAFIESTRTVESMSNEIKGGLRALTAQTTLFSFWRGDLNGNGSSEADEITTYSWDGTSGGNLLRTVSGVSTIVSRNVANLNFSYDSGTVSDIKAVTIALTSSLGGRAVTIESSAGMRNK